MISALQPRRVELSLLQSLPRIIGHEVLRLKHLLLVATFDQKFRPKSKMQNLAITNCNFSLSPNILATTKIVCSE
jgi:hypothetical protein